MNDLTADCLDIICAIWLDRTKSPEGMVVIKANDFLAYRDIKKRGEGGYQVNQKRDIEEQIRLLSNFWINVFEMTVTEEVKNKKGALKRQRIKKYSMRSRAIVLSSVVEEETSDGNSTYFWKMRSGDVFLPFLLGPGRPDIVVIITRRTSPFAGVHTEPRVDFLSETFLFPSKKNVSKLKPKLNKILKARIWQTTRTVRVSQLLPIEEKFGQISIKNLKLSLKTFPRCTYCLIVIVFILTKERIPSADSSLPYPECLMPPKGNRGSEATNVLIVQVPD
jgi:hypothetical protein